MANTDSAAASSQIALTGSPRRKATTPRQIAPATATAAQTSFEMGPGGWPATAEFRDGLQRRMGQ